MNITAWDTKTGPWGWFRPENRRVLERLIRDLQIRSVIEVGSFLGQSAAWFAHRVDSVVCIDTWEETATEISTNNLVETLRNADLPSEFYDIFEDNMRREGIRHKITPIRGKSADVAHLVEPADLVYLDADHSFDGCSSDIRLYGPKARKVLCGDDYLVFEGFGVVEAVNLLVPGVESAPPFWWRKA